MTTSVVVSPDLVSLAERAARYLAARLREVQTARGTAHLVLTGGRIGIATLAALAEDPAHREVDWNAVHLWWGDERFLPEADPDRNATQAHAALLDRIPVPAGAIHPMPAEDGPEGADLDAAAQRYAGELASFARRRPGTPDVPAFDIVLLGVGPDGHVASLFPGSATLAERTRTVVGVRDSPKPPPRRLSLTLPALCHAHEIWLLAAGTEKRDAVSGALSDEARSELPAASVHGRKRTLWFVDSAAAAAVPDRVFPPESPPA